MDRQPPHDRSASALSVPSETRRRLLHSDDVLLVTRAPQPAAPAAPGQPGAASSYLPSDPDVFIAMFGDGRVMAFNGHVDLGTGIRTSLAQIVAEELDLAPENVTMVLGHTEEAPNQGPTIASATIQISAVPLRKAAAQARHALLALAAQRLHADVAELQVRDGIVSARHAPASSISYAHLLHGRRIELQLASGEVALKPHDQYRVVGRSTQRVDIPAKVTGKLVYVHDMRVPGMLHGRVVRPPYAGRDGGDFVGTSLIAVDKSSIDHLPGIVSVVVQGDFIGIVAEREEQAQRAARELKVQWKTPPPLPALTNLDLESALQALPAQRRELLQQGDTGTALATAATGMGSALESTYVWPYQMHAAIGPSCSLADFREDSLTVWSGTQNPHVLRIDLARLLHIEENQIEIVRMEAAGCYGRNCADDVGADAALLSRAVGRPVRVQLTREQEHAWEPKGAAQLMQVNGGLNEDGSPAAYDFQTSYPSNGAPTLALLLTRSIEPVAQAFEMGDRTARPPYSYDNLRVSVHDMPPIVRASWLRGVSALPNAFAHESYIDELAAAAGVDPVAFRLQHLSDPRAIELVQATAQKAGWQPHTGPRLQADPEQPDWLHGQGFAYARYVHSQWPGFGAAWAAWVADVDVNRKTGEVHVRRVVVGHDAGLMVNPAGIERQVHGNVVQTTSRALKEQLQFENPLPPLGTPTPAHAQAPVLASRDWGSYPILSFREVPVVEIVHMPRPGEAPLGAGESSSVPGTAAIANAIFDATGVRFRAPPFTPEVVRAALNPLPPAAQGAGAEAPPQALPAPVPAGLPPGALLPRSRRPWARVGALLAAGVGIGLGVLGWRPAIAPVQSAGGASVYNAATLERGRLLAAAGDCAVCHTAPGGAVNAGGRAMDTPFGRLYTSNLTPDPETGLGRWSFSAFQRAMREGLSRDGHHLYPAFPYTAFAKMSDDDLTALYAWLMSQPPVRAETPAPEMRFPFNQRWLMAGWNAIYHDPQPWQPEPTQSPEWNRGAYLVQGLGHCGACHTPRNALGAEQGGAAFCRA